MKIMEQRIQHSLKPATAAARARALLLILAALSVACSLAKAQVSGGAQSRQYPWSDSSLSPDARADLVLREMTFDEKISLLHGQGMPFLATGPTEANGGAGFTKAIPRLGIPSVQMADSAYGVTRNAAAGRYSTALPSNLGAASAWDPDLMYQYGELIGRELRAQGYNMTLGGGVNLAREPRSGRTFEYQGDDPLLAGTLAGNLEKGIQSAHVIGDLKHFAVNDQETGRYSANAIIDQRALQETDLRAFKIALDISGAGAVMCAYNRVNGGYSCEDDYLLHHVLRDEFHFPGFVLSDWGATHSTVKASHAGLDQEQPNDFFYGDKLKKAVEGNEVSRSEINEHVHRILRTMFAAGLFDYPVARSVPDVEAGFDLAQTIAGKSIVLLRNEHGVLPLEPSAVHRVVLIGGHADKGVLSGGGSAQVDPPGGSAVSSPGADVNPLVALMAPAWMPSSPLRALTAAMPGANVSYVSGNDPAEAVAAAQHDDVAVVFAYQWEMEGMDLASLSLSPEQNQLIEAVASANPKTIVVLETGGPVAMPWIDKVAGVIEAWYPGIRGGEALAEILTGQINPSGKLAITFPLSDSDLPHPKLLAPPPEADLAPLLAQGDISVFMQRLAAGAPSFDIHYDEGLKVGYAWYEAEKKRVLFPFGFGLSYSQFAYSELEIEDGQGIAVSFTVSNTSTRDGVEIAEIYASLPDAAGEPPKRLVGWARVALAAGESRAITVPVARANFTVFDADTGSWKLVPGSYAVMVGSSLQDIRLQHSIALR